MRRNKYMVTVTDPIEVIIAGLTIVYCVLVSKYYWKVKNTDAFMWVLVTFFWCVWMLYTNHYRYDIIGDVKCLRLKV